MGPEGAFITGSDFLMDGGVTAAYRFGELAPNWRLTVGAAPPNNITIATTLADNGRGHKISNERGSRSNVRKGSKTAQLINGGSNRDAQAPPN